MYEKNVITKSTSDILRAEQLKKREAETARVPLSNDVGAARDARPCPRKDAREVPRDVTLALDPSASYLV